MDLRNRRRLQAGLIVAIFVLPIVGMLGMTWSGWMPHGRSYGERIRPERDLAGMPVRLADGKPFTFANREAVWTLVALPGSDCAGHCLRQLDLVNRARISLGQHAGNLRLLYLGAPPSGVAAKGFEKVWTLATTPSTTLDDLRTDARDSVSAVLVTPTGKALTRYAANFDPAGLRKDLNKVVH
jgi:cytochrome oxidase Cu insertion factor (SCO1/SenC/PrrC family)